VYNNKMNALSEQATLSDPISGLAKEILEHDFHARIPAPNPDECPFEQAEDAINGWNDRDHFTVFTAGTFDLLTLNHKLGLTQCRLLGAKTVLGLTGELSEQNKKSAHAIATSDSIRLMVSLDTNEQLEAAKSRDPEKGGAPKPLLDWATRAAMLGSVAIPIPGNQSLRRNSVDLITRHGIGCCSTCETGQCINRDNALMTVALQPSMVVVSGGSEKTIKDLYDYKRTGQLPRTEIAIMVEESLQYNDEVLQGAVSTSNIIRRARS
jgi:hypothetical protein